MKDLVLVTGITGFIAKHIGLQLLQQGYKVRGTVRNIGKSDSVRKLFNSKGINTSSLSFIEVDLLSDNGWEEAMRDVKYVLHVASPFPLRQPKNREALVEAARNGTLRVLRLAKKHEIERVVISSSIVAMMYRDNKKRQIHCA